MQCKLKGQALAVALITAGTLFSALPTSAHRYVVIDHPVVVEPDDTIDYGPGYLAPPAVYGYYHRPFSLHRFVGNAAKGTVGAGKDVVFGPSYYDWY